MPEEQNNSSKNQDLTSKEKLELEKHLIDKKATIISELIKIAGASATSGLTLLTSWIDYLPKVWYSKLQHNQGLENNKLKYEQEFQKSLLNHILAELQSELQQKQDLEKSKLKYEQEFQKSLLDHILAKHTAEVQYQHELQYKLQEFIRGNWKEILEISIKILEDNKQEEIDKLEKCLEQCPLNTEIIEHLSGGHQVTEINFKLKIINMLIRGEYSFDAVPPRLEQIQSITPIFLAYLTDEKARDALTKMVKCFKREFPELEFIHFFHPAIWKNQRLKELDEVLVIRIYEQLKGRNVILLQAKHNKEKIDVYSHRWNMSGEYLGDDPICTVNNKDDIDKVNVPSLVAFSMFIPVIQFLLHHYKKDAHIKVLRLYEESYNYFYNKWCEHTSRHIISLQSSLSLSPQKLLIPSHHDIYVEINRILDNVLNSKFIIHNTLPTLVEVVLRIEYTEEYREEIELKLIENFPLEDHKLTKKFDEVLNVIGRSDLADMLWKRKSKDFDAKDKKVSW